jgi:aminopeptidase N
MAGNVHDFVWAADPEYLHVTKKLKGNGPVIHVLYKNPAKIAQTDADWNKVADAAGQVLPFMEMKFGRYPYPQYSFIHGGDGGMEYPMATLLVGPGLGTVFHEWMHSWYQMMLGTNESMYAWMDEGFTEYAADLVEAYYRETVTRKELAGNKAALAQLDSSAAVLPLEHSGNYSNYYYLAQSPWQEPLTTHADHFNSNFGYSISSYSKGCVFLEQLGYITGAAVRDSILLAYYRNWRFRHPGAADFIKVAENLSGMKLDWYQEYWCNTTKTIDYAIDSLWEEGGVSKLRIKRIGQMPMPIDVQLDFSDGKSALHYVPLNLQYGAKPAESEALSRTVHEPWRWTHPTYVITFSQRLATLKRVQIDPTKRMADVDQRNNDLKINW